MRSIQKCLPARWLRRAFTDNKAAQGEECRLPFEDLPAAAQEIIGTKAGRRVKRRMRNWTLQQVRQAQELNRRFGRFMLEGKEQRVLRFDHMEKRRVVRAVEATEKAGALKGIAQTHPVASVARNGDLVLRRLTAEEAARYSERGFTAGELILARRPSEKQVPVARVRKAERLAANKALAGEIRRRRARVDTRRLAAEFAENRYALGWGGRRATATAEELMATAPQGADRLIREQVR